MGPYYNRILNYHGAQDISYMLMNSPLIRRGCTAFGAWGARHAEGHLLCGRNFDWEADPVFDEDRILIICEPKNGIPFISLAWAGMAGCVSGHEPRRRFHRRQRRAVASARRRPRRRPAWWRAKFWSTRTISPRRPEIIRKRQVFVSAMFLVGSRADGKFIVIEKTPEKRRCASRRKMRIRSFAPIITSRRN
jgi:isopenicillin-N N-acyltransferase-like protein